MVVSYYDKLLRHKVLLILIFCLFIFDSISAQQEAITIKQFRWGPDYQLYLQLENDSVYSYDFDEIIHANPDEVFSRPSEFIFYPVTFDSDYIDSLLTLANSHNDFTIDSKTAQPRKLTLWNSLRDDIGGGWVHFLNCLLFAMESKYLDLKAPMLQKQQSNWKPNPMTETWKRTHKWKYCIPIEYKYALKEYHIRKKQGQLGDLKSIPQQYIDLFLKTSDKKVKKLEKKGDFKTIAKINLVKLMLGAPYLSEPQIEFIRSRVLLAISNYNMKNKPSVLIFDKYNAAVAVTMDGLGYKAKKIVFKDEYSYSPEEIFQRTNIILGLIELINYSNAKAFKQKINELYK